MHNRLACQNIQDVVCVKPLAYNMLVIWILLGSYLDCGISRIQLRNGQQDSQKISAAFLLVPVHSTIQQKAGFGLSHEIIHHVSARWGRR